MKILNIVSQNETKIDLLISYNYNHSNILSEKGPTLVKVIVNHIIQSFCLQASVVQWKRAGELVNRSSDQSCARGLIQNTISH